MHPREDEPLEPNSAYAAAKAAATAARARATAPSCCGSTRPTGRGRSRTGSCRRCSAGRSQDELPPLVSPRVARDFVYVDDVCEAFVARRRAPSPAASTTSARAGRRRSPRSSRPSRKLAGIEAEPQWGSMPDRSWDTETWVANPERIRRELGWEARDRARGGPARTLDWLRTEAPPERYGSPG